MAGQSVAGRVRRQIVLQRDGRLDLVRPRRAEADGARQHLLPGADGRSGPRSPGPGPRAAPARPPHPAAPDAAPACSSISASNPCASASSGNRSVSRRASRIASVLRDATVRIEGHRLPIALREHQVEHQQHRREAIRELLGTGHLVRDARRPDGPLGAHQPLRDGRLGHQERPRDGRGLDAGHGAQGQGDACLGRQQRVAAGEDETQPVVRDGFRLVQDVVRRIDLVVARLGPGARPPSRPADGHAGCGRWPAGEPSVVIQAPGRSGMPSVGQCSSAARKASCTASSAVSKSPPRDAMRLARTRPDSARKTSSTASRDVSGSGSVMLAA